MMKRISEQVHNCIFLFFEAGICIYGELVGANCAS
jgi:hypothetical protein